MNDYRRMLDAALCSPLSLQHAVDIAAVHTSASRCSQLWKFLRGDGERPSSAAVAEAVELVEASTLRYSMEQTVTLAEAEALRLLGFVLAARSGVPGDQQNSPSAERGCRLLDQLVDEHRELRLGQEI